MTASLQRAIASGASRLDVPLDQAGAQRLAELLERVLRFNQRINVVGPCTAEQAVERHILDSLAFLRLADRLPTLNDWVDVGSGAGFPGLVWAIARPKMQLLLVESIGKKAALLRRHVIEMDLKNVEVTSSRFESLPRPTSPLGLVSRATFRPALWLSSARPFLQHGGAVLVTMGGEADQDILKGAKWVDRLTLGADGPDRTNVLVEVA